MKEVDPSGESTDAGMSLLREISVPPLNARRIGADTASLGFQRYVHRCGTCHTAPSPSIRTAPEWGYVFPRMQKHISEAGLIPLEKEDQAVILEFLQRHAQER